jgi:hypothetical protein
MSENNVAPLLQPLQFNINQSVKVKLTERGREIYHWRMHEDHLSNNEALRRLEAITDEAGYSKFQLYVLIGVFGERMQTFPSMDPRDLPFETEIILVPDPLEVAVARREASDRLLYGDGNEINY